MLLIPLILSQNEPAQDPVVYAARKYSWDIVNRLQNNRHEVQPLIGSMTHICARMPAMHIANWTEKLGMMPPYFSFGDNNVVYREFVGGGVLMMTECTHLQPFVGPMGRVINQRMILNSLFFATAAGAAGVYEVRCILPNDPRDVVVADRCGNDFLTMIARMPYNP